jgi:hypothetical protein
MDAVLVLDGRSPSNLIQESSLRHSIAVPETVGTSYVWGVCR